jgi:hypothetical protein
MLDEVAAFLLLVVVSEMFLLFLFFEGTANYEMFEAQL